MLLICSRRYTSSILRSSERNSREHMWPQWIQVGDEGRDRPPLPTETRLREEVQLKWEFTLYPKGTAHYHVSVSQGHAHCGSYLRAPAPLVSLASLLPPARLVIYFQRWQRRGGWDDLLPKPLCHLPFAGYLLCFTHVSWIRRPYVPPKHLCISTRLYNATSQKAVFFYSTYCSKG
jgi:hypothetical protein